MTGWAASTRALLAAAALAASSSSQAADATDSQLERMQLSLSSGEPYRFVLAYRGPPRAYRGLLCYWFAGYNETCLKPALTWLTAATEIELYAPGGVPRDLLEGYTMLVRYPSLSERVFRYALPEPD